jgi:hydrogenase maturation protease
MPESAARILVLGLGNDILTDDAVGLQVARVVRERLAGDPRIEVNATTEMGLALLDEMAGRAGVVLVDSVQTGRAAPGFIHEIDAAELTNLSSNAPHMLGVGETLALARMVGVAMPQRVRVFAIEVADPFSLGTELTPPVRAAVASAAERIVVAARALADFAGEHDTQSSR